MSLQLAESPSAREAYALVQELQALLVKQLESIPSPHGVAPFVSVPWLRAQGIFGGGARFVATDEIIFDRASVNISQVQYEKDPQRKLASASALSTIVHPRHPLSPSMHMHISWTEMKDGTGYWRIMGDLNPSHPDSADRDQFEAALQAAVGEELFAYGKGQGERYFYIPALERYRGIAHFYLEEYKSENQGADLELARRFGRALIFTYKDILSRRMGGTHSPPTEEQRKQQLAYHSLYFLQVLTLDRGTTSGLLVHNENDTGILGSLPSHVDKVLLGSWVAKLPKVQQALLQGLLGLLPGEAVSLVDDTAKVNIAEFCRQFYREHPEAQDVLARGDRIPPTQQNHLS